MCPDGKEKLLGFSIIILRLLNVMNGLGLCIKCFKSISPKRVFINKTDKTKKPIFLYLLFIINIIDIKIHMKPELPSLVKKIIMGFKKSFCT